MKQREQFVYDHRVPLETALRAAAPQQSDGRREREYRAEEIARLDHGEAGCLGRALQTTDRVAALMSEEDIVSAEQELEGRYAKQKMRTGLDLANVLTQK